MQKIKVITDSTSSIPMDFIKEYDISVVPLSYTFEGKGFKEGFPGEFDSFFNKLSTSKSFPTTSQPSVITLSSKISGTYNGAVLAKNMLEEEKISVVDSLQSASNLRF